SIARETILPLLLQIQIQHPIVYGDEPLLEVTLLRRQEIRSYVDRDDLAGTPGHCLGERKDVRDAPVHEHVVADPRRRKVERKRAGSVDSPHQIGVLVMPRSEPYLPAAHQRRSI